MLFKSGFILLTLFTGFSITIPIHELTVAGRIAMINCQTGNCNTDEKISTNHRKRRVAYYKWPLWNTRINGTIEVPYILANELSVFAKISFEAAVISFQQKTCIRFVPRTNQEDFLSVIVDEGCYSSVGRIGGKQILSLGLGCGFKGVIEHELLHALGMGHTQIRGDRDRHLIIDWSNIKPGFESQFKSLVPIDELDILGEKFCFESIMMYGRYDFALEPTKPVLTPIDFNGELGQQEGMAQCDLDQINRLYKCMDYLTILGPDGKPEPRK